MRWQHAGFALVAMALLAGAASGAQVVDTTGDMSWEGQVPSDLTRHAVESDTKQMLFLERDHVLLEDDLSAADGEIIPAGTKVTSYLIHADPEGSGVGYSGGVTFSKPILGVFSWVTHLEATDPILGLPETEYDNHRWLNTDFGDSIEISEDRRTFTLSNSVQGALDEVRIAVKAAPSPSTFAIAVPMIGLMAMRARRRRKSRA